MAINESRSPILEVAILNVIPEKNATFQDDFAKAQQYIQAIEGYLDHQLQQCIENPCRYVLLVRWETLEAHTEGFRRSPEYQNWKRLLHHYYQPFPTVEHYQPVQLDP